MTHIRFAAVSHRGLIRSRNEDNYGATGLGISRVDGDVVGGVANGSQPFVAVVADGLGGHPCGEIASALAVESVLRANPSDSGSLLQGVLDADQLIRRRMTESDRCAGMATTIAAVLVHDADIVVVNVGDSAVFELVDGRLTQLSTDDVPLGRTTLPGLPPAGLTQTLGGAAGIADPHLLVGSGRDAGRLLLCTDGLTNFVTLRQITEVVRDRAVCEAARALVTLALDAGGVDNVTCVVLEIG